MRISIAMCTYNGETYLQQQLDSFLRQTRRPDELIVCDDGSTDATIAMLQRFSNSAPFSVQVHRNPKNLGSTLNFVQAISLCTGNLIALSDQDDVWKTNKLLTLLQVFEQDGLADAAFSDGELINAEAVQMGRSLWSTIDYTKAMQRQVNRGEGLKVLRHRYFVTGATLMIRARARTLFSDTPPEWIHDAWMTWKLVTYGKLVSVPHCLIEYRVHAANQVGVRVDSVAQSLSQRSNSQAITALVAEAARLSQLRDQSAWDPVYQSSMQMRAMNIVDAKVQFLTRRASILQRNRLFRFLYMLPLARQYSTYSRGWSSFLADIVL